MMDETILTDSGAVTRLMGDFKNHLRLTTDDADADLRSKLMSALSSVGNDVNRILAASTVTATAVVDSLGGKIRLTLRGPVREVSSVSVNGVALVPGEGYVVSGNRLTINGDYSDAFVEIVYKAGYADTSMPSDMWEAVCLRGAGSYANPLDTVQERMRASDILIRPYRYKEWQS
ncbi:MAG: hypothetical protein J5639_09275 [Bacteroidales bacterium]|nr:hypothetical protein [Bacteroidales bacterium]